MANIRMFAHKHWICQNCYVGQTIECETCETEFQILSDKDSVIYSVTSQQNEWYMQQCEKIGCKTWICSNCDQELLDIECQSVQCRFVSHAICNSHLCLAK